jgi:broad specificity phosphatase PhoE
VGITLYLVRHGEAAGNWDNSVDPGLSKRGREQAEIVADRLCNQLSPIDIFCSPLARTRETAEPFSRRWKREAIITPELTEVPSAGVDLGDRRKWLTGVRAGIWPEQSETLSLWREDILKFVHSRREDAVLVTHFVVINAIVSAIEKSDNVVVFRPDNCSVTVVSLENEARIIEKGVEADTVVK